MNLEGIAQISVKDVKIASIFLSMGGMSPLTIAILPGLLR